MLRLIAESPTTALIHGMDMIAICCSLVMLGLIPMVGYDVFWQLYSHFKSCACRVRKFVMNTNSKRVIRT